MINTLTLHSRPEAYVESLKEYAQKNLKLILSLLALNIIAYFIFIAHHPLHNHGFRMPWIPLNDQFQHGRWMNLIILRLMGGADIPVLPPMIAISLSILSGLVFLDILKAKLTQLEAFLVIGVFTTCPIFLAFFYYTYSTVMFMSAVLFAVTGIAVCKKLSFAPIFLGAIAFLMMMGSYQPAVSLFATLLVSSAIIELIKAEKFDWWKWIQLPLSRVIAAALGSILYLISLRITGAKSHATKMIDFADLPTRIVQVTKASFEQFILTQPDFRQGLNTLLLVVILAVFIQTLIATRKSLTKTLLLLICWFGLVVATKAMYFISATTIFYEYRYNPGLPFFYAFMICLGFVVFKFKFFRATFILVSGIMLANFVHADLLRQEILFRGQQHDLALASRVLSRIEALPDIDFNKTYDLVRVGRYPDFRRKIFRSRGHTWDVAGDTHMDNAQITALWADEDVFILLGSRIKFKHRGMDPQFKAKIAYAKENLLQDRLPWPHTSSVFIHDEKIIVYMN